SAAQTGVLALDVDVEYPLHLHELGRSCFLCRLPPAPAAPPPTAPLFARLDGARRSRGLCRAVGHRRCGLLARGGRLRSLVQCHGPAFNLWVISGWAGCDDAARSCCVVRAPCTPTAREARRALEKEKGARHRERCLRPRSPRRSGLRFHSLDIRGLDEDTGRPRRLATLIRTPGKPLGESATPTPAGRFCGS